MSIRKWSVVTFLFVVASSIAGAQVGVQTQPATLTIPPGLVALSGQSQAPTPTAKAIQTILEDDFEGSFPGQWELFSDTTTHWGQTTHRASGGSRSAYCAGGGGMPAPAGGPYFNNQVTWMRFGPFSLADATEATVQFDLWMKTQQANGGVFFDYFFYGISVDGENYSGFQTAGNPAVWDTRQFNVSEITAVTALGQPQVWLALVFISDSSITDEGVYLDNFSLTKSVPGNPCTVSCSANAPGSATVGEQVSFTGSATASNCTGTPTYSWNFGDQTQASTAQNPSHVYSSEGSYTWTMTASVDGQTCQKNGSITVSASAANFAEEYWVPAAAHAPGSLGSQWRTDLGLYNPNDSATALRIDFHDGATIRSLNRSVSAGASELLEDVIGLYNVTASGALEILTEQEVYVTSRTYNEGASGTFGQYLDGTDPIQALGNGQLATLPQLREDPAFRTNIGLLNTSDSNTVAQVGLYDGNGALLQTFERTLRPGILLQENRPFANIAGRTDIVRGYATVTVVSGSGVLAYASVIDNQTQDPTTIPMKGGATEIRLGWIAAAAHASGSLGSQWRTDLGLLNRQGAPANVTITLRMVNATHDLPATVPAGAQQVLEDVIGMMGADGAGSLEISSDVPIYITSRTYNQGSSGTFGQFLDGYSADTGVGSGQTVILSQLSENAAYRSNTGFVNTSSADASVKVELLAADGSVLGDFSKTLAAGENWQKNRPFSTVAGQSNVSGGAARVEVTSGSGVIAYASVIDSQTQDPTTIPMKGGGELGGILGTVKDPAGSALADATVVAAGKTTSTNSQGYYVLDSIPVAAEMPVAFSKEGYVPTTKVLRVVAGESNTQNAVLFPAEATTTIQSNVGGTLTTPDGASITIAPNTLVDSNGQTFSGPATVTLTSFDPSVPAELEAFPGTFQGVDLSGQTVFINTFGFADITVTSGTEQLQLTQGATAELDLPIPSSLLDGAPADMPSWWFDPDSHTWFEVGTFTRDNSTYRTGIPHFSIWNCDVAATRCYVSGRVVDEDGLPVKGARVTFLSYRRGGGYVSSGETSTPRNGTFRVPVDANADIEFWAEKGDIESDHGFDHACAHNGEMNVGDIVLAVGGGGPIIGITLTWDENPRDLDAHLTVPDRAGGWEHIYYNHKVGADAVLDTDDQHSYGPEIVTVQRIPDGVYRYSVHHYTGDEDITHSGARVSVVGGGISYRIFTPPGGAQGRKDSWRVFDLNCLNGRCTLSRINDYLNGVSASDASSFEP